MRTGKTKKITFLIPSSLSLEALKRIKSNIGTVSKFLRLTTTELQFNFLIISHHRPSESFVSLNPKMVKIIYSRINTFTALNNKGVSYLEHSLCPDYVIFLNDDAFISIRFLRRLDKIIFHNIADVIIPLIKKPHQKEIESFGVKYYYSGYAKENRKIEESASLFSAASLIVNFKSLLRIKKNYGYVFNPLFEFYYEDIDLAIRMVQLGMVFTRDKHLVVTHIGSATSGHKSFFTIYHTYRNLIWIIITVWPLRYIIRNILNIVIVQIWFFFYSSFNYKISFYPKLIVDTLRHLQDLIEERRRHQSLYPNRDSFSNIFSPYTFETYHGQKF